MLINRYHPIIMRSGTWDWVWNGTAWSWEELNQTAEDEERELSEDEYVPPPREDRGRKKKDSKDEIIFSHTLATGEGIREATGFVKITKLSVLLLNDMKKRIHKIKLTNISQVALVLCNRTKYAKKVGLMTTTNGWVTLSLLSEDVGSCASIISCAAGKSISTIVTGVDQVKRKLKRPSSSQLSSSTSGTSSPIDAPLSSQKVETEWDRLFIEQHLIRRSPRQPSTHFKNKSSKTIEESDDIYDRRSETPPNCSVYRTQSKVSFYKQPLKRDSSKQSVLRRRSSATYRFLTRDHSFLDEVESSGSFFARDHSIGITHRPSIFLGTPEPLSIAGLARYTSVRIPVTDGDDDDYSSFG